jgi:HNH endonuclease
MSVKRIGQTLLESIEARFIPDPFSGCWLWTEALDSDGYSRIWYPPERRTRPAHRVLYEMTYGIVVDPEWHLDHLCRVRSCVNPKHLEAVTEIENIRRGNSGKHQAARTHCPQGHPYNLENTYIGKQSKGRKGFGRQCRVCHAETQLKYSSRKRGIAENGQTP